MQRNTRTHTYDDIDEDLVRTEIDTDKLWAEVGRILNTHALNVDSEGYLKYPSQMWSNIMDWLISRHSKASTGESTTVSSLDGYSSS
jgi:hypothetical protein